MNISKEELEGLILERTSELLSTSRQLREERHGRNAVELSLAQYRELQTLVTEQSGQLLIARDATQLASVCERILRQTARFLGVDQACIVLSSGAGQPYRILHEWRLPEADETTALENTVDLEMLPWFQDRLQAGVAVLDAVTIPREIAEAETSWLERQGLQSVWAFPLRGDDRLMGYLAYLHQRKTRSWPVEYQDSLRMLAHVLASALYRAQIQAQSNDVCNLLDLTLRSTRDGVMLIDMAERVTMVNESTLALLGRQQAEVIGQPFADVFRISEAKDAEPSPFPLRLIRRAGFAAKQPRYMLMDEQRAIRAVIEARSQAVLDADGTRRGDIVLLTDCSRASGFEQERSIQGKLRSLGHLAAGLAHEISTPMQYISDNTSFFRDVLRSVIAVRERYFNLLLAQADESERQLVRQLRIADAEHDIDFNLREAFSAIDQTISGVEKVGTLVTAMKSLARYVNRGRQTIDLNLAVRDVLTLTDHEWRYIAEIDLNLFDGLPETVVEIEEVNQVLIEIIGNACDSIQRAIASKLIKVGRIGVRTVQDGNRILIEITDNGVGMSEMVRERMFDPYFSTKALGSGAGQGMGLAKEVIVNRHGGTIEVESEEGKGARILIRLPLIDGSPSTDMARTA